MAAQFKIIGIMGRVGNPGVIESLKMVIEFLIHLGYEVRIEAETAIALQDYHHLSIPAETLSETCDLLIVVGGDGSLLQAIHTVIREEIPVIGINRGRLGFLTDIHPAELEKIKDILEGNYILEKRFLLNAEIHYDGKQLGTCSALNEVALIPASVPHMSEFEIYIDDQFVLSQNSDGVIIATPTGSTAYALSAGGPILHPQLDAMVIVPMFPHTLSIRPLVVEGHHRLTIIITRNNTTIPRLTADATAFINTPPGSQITISKKAEHLHLIHPLDYDYYETLRTKLHWGHK